MKLALLPLAILASTAFAADPIPVTVTASACEPNEITVPSGKVTFKVTNKSMKALEWEILQGVMIVDERENIAPMLSANLTTTLLPGEYEMTCGLLSNPHGKLIVTDSGYKPTEGQADMQKLAAPLAEYKIYTLEQADELEKATAKFTQAIIDGKADEARAMYAETRKYYERIEPIAELFSDLDAAIDARADDYKEGEKDPDFTGFHKLEYLLFDKKDISDAAPIAKQLNEDVVRLNQQLRELAFPPKDVVGGAASLMEEVASSKISGEEDRYSHTDLSDFRANVDGAQKIVALFRPLLEEKNAAFLKTVDVQFEKVDTILDKYKKNNGYELYDKLTAADRNQLKAAINTLAEDLSKMRGVLGID